MNDLTIPYQRTKSSIALSGIYLAAFTFPFDFSIMGGVTLFRLMVFLTIYGWLINTLMNQRKIIYFNKVTLFAAFFVFFCLLSSFWSISQHHLLKTTMLLFLFTVFYFISIDTISTKPMFDRFGLSYLWGCLLAGATAILKITLGFIPPGGRVAAFSYQNLNVFGATMAVGILISVYFLKNAKRLWYRLLFLVAFVVLLIALFVSGSRMAWLSLIISVVLSIILGLKAVHRKRAIVGLLLVTILGVGCLYSFVYLRLLPKGTSDYLILRSTIKYAIKDRGATRLGVFHAAWVMFKDNPIVGVGLQNFKVKVATCERYSALISKPVGGAHNMYLSVLAELGIIGGLLWFILLGFSFKYALQCRDPSCRFLSFSIVIFLAVSGMFAESQIFGWFWLLLTLSHACSHAHYIEETFPLLAECK